MVLKIVAIGGGEIGRPKEGGGNYPVETTSIDKEIIKLTGKKKPKLLFVPTASNDSAGYLQVIKNHFGKRMGCKVDVLHLIKEKPAKKEIEKKVLGADIIYVGGGNTLKLMRHWRKTGFDKIIKKAAKKGIVLSGVSAGAICWFRCGNSDSRKFKNPKADYIKAYGLGLIDALCCPHYNTEKDRQPSLKKMMKKTGGVALALDNCAALEVIGKKARIITSKKSANAHKIYWKNQEFFKEKIQKNKWFMSTNEIILK